MTTGHWVNVECSVGADLRALATFLMCHCTECLCQVVGTAALCSGGTGCNSWSRG
jgi:hypothetical protein